MKGKRRMSEKTATTAVRGTNPMRTAEVHLPMPAPGKAAISP